MTIAADFAERVLPIWNEAVDDGLVIHPHVADPIYTERPANAIQAARDWIRNEDPNFVDYSRAAWGPARRANEAADTGIHSVHGLRLLPLDAPDIFVFLIGIAQRQITPFSLLER